MAARKHGVRHNDLRFAIFGFVVAVVLVGTDSIADSDTEAVGRFQTNLAGARAKVTSLRPRYHSRSTTMIPGHNAAILSYGDTSDSVILAIGSGNSNVVEFWPEETVAGDDPSVSVGRFCDLRGDGIMSVSASNGQIAWVVDLINDSWVQANSVPDHPVCDQDLDGDRLPEHKTGIATVEIAACDDISTDGNFNIREEIEGYSAWDGHAYAKDLRPFRPLYDRDLASVRAELPKLRRKVGAGCPNDLVRVASSLYLFNKILGQEAAGLAEADRAMQGATTRNCGSTPTPQGRCTRRTWPEIKAELRRMAVPMLTRDRSFGPSPPSAAPSSSR